MLKTLKRMPDRTSRSRPRAAGEEPLVDLGASAARLLERGFADVENLRANLGEHGAVQPESVLPALPAIRRRAARNRIRARILPAATAALAETIHLRP